MAEATNDLKYIPFESFKIGQKQNFGAYEVTEKEIIEFASKYDSQFFFGDFICPKVLFLPNLKGLKWDIF